MTPHSHGENAPLARRRALTMLLRAAAAPPPPRRPAARRPGRAAPKCTRARRCRGWATSRSVRQSCSTNIGHDADARRSHRHPVTMRKLLHHQQPALVSGDAARLLVAARMGEESARATGTARRRSRQTRRCARHRVRSTCRWCSKGERTGTMTCDSPSSAAPQRAPRRAAQHAPCIVLVRRHQRREG